MHGTYSSVPKSGAGTFIILMKNSKISQLLTRLLSYSVLLLPARLFGPALLFGTLG